MVQHQGHALDEIEAEKARSLPKLFYFYFSWLSGKFQARKNRGCLTSFKEGTLSSKVGGN
jgi:hypothetical protein